MSIDYNIICDECKVYMHFGQCGGSHRSIGYGSKDIEGQEKVFDFLQVHACCDGNLGARIVDTDFIFEHDNRDDDRYREINEIMVTKDV